MMLVVVGEVERVRWILLPKSRGEKRSGMQTWLKFSGTVQSSKTSF